MRHGRYPFVVAFLLAPITIYTGLVLWPYAQTFGYSLTDWSGQSQRMTFVGLGNYAKLFGDQVFRTALWHNLLLLALLPVATILIALFFAFMLNVGGRGGTTGVRGVRGAGFYKVVFFFPQVLSIAIIAVLWGAVYRTDGSGLANGILVGLGLVDPQHPVAWLSDPSLVLWCVLAVLVWSGVGFYLVLFSAAMQSIPRDVYEAALLDGARRGQTFLRITLPLLLDTVQTAWVYLAIVAMDAFALVSSITPGAYFGGGPDHHSELISTYLMRSFLRDGQAGYACAMGVVIFFFTLTLSVLALWATRREQVEY